MNSVLSIRRTPARQWIASSMHPEREPSSPVEWSEGRWSFLAIAEAAEALPALVRQVASGSCPESWDRRSCGRDFIVIAPLELRGRGVRVVVRPYRRGGVVRRMIRATYWGRSPRSFDEFRCLLELRRRGVEAVAPVGAAAYWRGGWFYQAWLATEYVEGSATLWEWLQKKPRDDERQRVLEATARVIAQFHRAGGSHPDLNLQNVLVQWRGGAPCAWLVDLDRVALRAEATHPYSTLRRLWRSATKLDRSREYWSDRDQALLEQAVERHWTEG